MWLRHLSVADFRNYASAEVEFAGGVSTFLGLNGQGKTNLLEAVGYLSTLSSHRVAHDAPLVRQGQQAATVRALVTRNGRDSLAELQINPGRANRARLNRSPLTRPRDLLGTLRTVLFAPEDLALVKGDPSGRRAFLDDLLVQRQPRWAGVRADYDKIVRQRNALLKATGVARRRGGAGPQASADASLQVWTEQLAGIGAQLLYARLRLLRDLTPLVESAYADVSAQQGPALARYRVSLEEEFAAQIAAGAVPDPADLQVALLHRLDQLRTAELERGYSLAGPHRDDIDLALGSLPAKGYASHGECWSFALALRLAAFHLLRHDLGEDPVLLLDDVFAELDATRRTRLAALVCDAEQVIVTAAVANDVPEQLTGAVFAVCAGQVTAAAGGGGVAAQPGGAGAHLNDATAAPIGQPAGVEAGAEDD